MRSVVIFGRQPVAGSVKTRLARGVGPGRAAAVYAALLRHALEVAQQGEAEVVLSLAATPAPGWKPPSPTAVEVQAPGDLGCRMAEAFARRFVAGARVVVLIGSDCPGLRPRHLVEAFSALETAGVVLGPATDGGYWLVGQRTPGIDLFSGVPWSHPETLAATRRRLHALGAAWSELEKLADIDTEEDLTSYCAAAAPGDEVAASLEAALRERC